jgi:hypothetical protein
MLIKNFKYFFVGRFYDLTSFDSRFLSETATGVKILDVHDHSYATSDSMPKAGHTPISVPGTSSSTITSPVRVDNPNLGKVEDFPYNEIFISR